MSLLQAATRNPDEFYFGMIRSQTQVRSPTPCAVPSHAIFTSQQGRHIIDPNAPGAKSKKKQGKKGPSEELQLMQSQDAAYLQMKRTHEAHRIEQMQGDLHGIAAAEKLEKTADSARHTIFVDTLEEGASNCQQYSASYDATVGRSQGV